MLQYLLVENLLTECPDVSGTNAQWRKGGQGRFDHSHVTARHVAHAHRYSGRNERWDEVAPRP